MSKILITGKDGFMGKSIIPELQKYSHYIHTTNHKDLDLIDFNKVEKFFEKESYDFVINCAVAGNGKNTDTLQNFYDNLTIIENLLYFDNKYSKLILFDSGAVFNRKINIFDRKESEFYSIPSDYYGLSKYIMNKRIKNNPKICNLRIFNCFGPLENDDRFIKSCIKKYIDRSSITIYEDKYFDFFSINDLMVIIKSLISIPPKEYFELNCVYNKKYKLSQIANTINSFNFYKVPIIINKESNLNYCGNGDKLNKLNLPLIELSQGIKNVYNFLNK